MTREQFFRLCIAERNRLVRLHSTAALVCFSLVDPRCLAKRPRGCTEPFWLDPTCAMIYVLEGSLRRSRQEITEKIRAQLGRLAVRLSER